MTKRLLITASVLAGLLCLALAVAWAAGDVVTFEDDNFQAVNQRPAVVFDHDAHNAAAELEDKCVVCHHAGENGKIVPGETSEGTECAECHKLEMGADGTNLLMAYHKQCKNCHAQMRKGPVSCGECHVR